MVSRVLIAIYCFRTYGYRRSLGIRYIYSLAAWHLIGPGVNSGSLARGGRSGAAQRAVQTVTKV